MIFDITSGKYKGLTANQAKEKLRTGGYNNLPSPKPKKNFTIVLGIIKKLVGPCIYTIKTNRLFTPFLVIALSKLINKTYERIQIIYS